MRIERLDGRLADQPLRLAGPATVTLAGGTVAVSDLNLRLGEARVAGAFDLGAAAGRGGGDARAAAARVARRALGAPELSGRLGGRLSLRGAADNPSGSIRLEATNVAVPAPAFADMPPARTRR